MNNSKRRIQLLKTGQPRRTVLSVIHLELKCRHTRLRILRMCSPV